MNRKNTNPVKYIYLLGAILCGSAGMISMLISNEGIWAWIPWLAFIPAYMLLVLVAEDYGIGPAYTLWSGAVVLAIAIFVMLYGASWGETLSDTQYIALLTILVGVVGLTASQPKKEQPS